MTWTKGGSRESKVSALGGWRLFFPKTDSFLLIFTWQILLPRDGGRAVYQNPRRVGKKEELTGRLKF